MRIIIETDERQELTVSTVGEPAATEALDAGPPAAELLSALGNADRDYGAAGTPPGEHDAGAPPGWLTDALGVGGNA